MPEDMSPQPAQPDNAITPPADQAQTQPPAEPPQPVEPTPPTEQAQPPAEGAGPADGAAPAEADDALPKAKITVEEAGALRKKITVEIDRQRIQAKYDEMFGELNRTAQVPGFRVGHAPRRLIERRFGREVGQDVRNALVGDALRDSGDQLKLQVLGEPDLDLEKIELPEQGSLVFSFEIEVAPEFELPPIKGIKLKKVVQQVTDEVLQRAVDLYRQQLAVLKPSEEPAEVGDMLTADVSLSGEGIQVAREAVEVRVAPGSVEGIPLEDLQTALAGKKPGDTVELKNKVPEGHPAEAWRGKDVSIRFEVKELKKLELPEADDQFAARIGHADMRDMRDSIRRNLSQRLAERQQELLREQAAAYLLRSVDFQLPEEVARRHGDRVFQRRLVDLMMQSIPREQIEQHLERIERSARGNAAHLLKLDFILGKLADREKIEVSDDELNSRIARIARVNNRRPERLRQELQDEGRLDDLRTAIRDERVLDWVVNSAKIVEVTQEQFEAEAAAPAAEEQPAPAAPAEEKPAEDKPAEEKPAPADDKSAPDEPGEDKPAPEGT